jgi:hypothetical protein
MSKSKVAKIEPAPVNDVQPSRCAKCGSTRRADYHNVTRSAHAGELPDGTTYNMVVFRRTHCLDCGQQRVDRTFETAAADSPPDGENPQNPE